MIQRYEAIPPRMNNPFADNQLLYLPGVVDKSNFMELCEGCLSCAKACPEDCITYIDVEPGVRYPFIAPHEKPCYLCEDMPCSAACPSGAVSRLPLEKVKMGTAMLDPLRCLCLNEGACHTCYEVCPLSGKALLWDDEVNAPLINMSACVGCGVCVFECPSPENPLMIVPR